MKHEMSKAIKHLEHHHKGNHDHARAHPEHHHGEKCEPYSKPGGGKLAKEGK